MRRSILAATGSLILACVGITQAGVVFSDGFDTLYKPGTGRTVTATFEGYTDNNPQYSFGTNAHVNSSYLATYSDSTTGQRVDIPNWTADFNNYVGIIHGATFSLTPTSGPTFAYIGGATNYVRSDAVGFDPAATEYTLSIDFMGASGGNPALPMFADLLANGVALTPSSSSSPDPTISGTFVTWTRTYDAVSLLGLSAGDPLQVKFGTTAGNGMDKQTYVDTAVLSNNVVPEPASLGLLGLMGLGLIRRRKVS